MPSLLQNLLTHEAQLNDWLPTIHDLREKLGAQGDLSLPQWAAWIATALEFKPTLILDLGTGGGNSAALWALIATRLPVRVLTFDQRPGWAERALPRLDGAEINCGAVTPIVGDLTKYDFRPLIAPTDRVLILLDAHGFAVVSHLLSHVMPIIADQPHIVLCHDITDARYSIDVGYAGRPIFTGMANAGSAHLRIQWALTMVDQHIALFDFCARNGIELRSADHDFRAAGDDAGPALLKRLFGGDGVAFHYAFFTMNDTAKRDFPGPL